MTRAETQAGFDRRKIPERATETRWALPDGHSLRRIDWPGRDGLAAAAPRGSLLYMPGRGDFYEKYLETLDHWSNEGWRVTAADWRGQGMSGRLGMDAVTGHVADFSVWVDDLAALWAAWCAETPGPHVLVTHSMGGQIALRALAENRIDPVAAVLVAPLLDVAGPPLPRWLLHGAVRLMAALGDPRRPAWKWSEKPGQVPADRAALLTGDADRYADELWWREHRPEVVMGPGSWGWLERAFASMRGLERPGVLERIQTPVQFLAAERDRLVGLGGILRAAARLPQGELLRFGPEARHELLREGDVVRSRALAAIDEFLDRRASASCS
jgi:lysophospholipase